MNGKMMLNKQFVLGKMEDEAIVWSLRNFKEKIGATLGNDEIPISRIRMSEMNCSTDVFNELLDYLVQMVD